MVYCRISDINNVCQSETGSLAERGRGLPHPPGPAHADVFLGFVSA